MVRTQRFLIVDNDPEAADTLGLLLKLISPTIRTMTTYKGPSAVELASEGYFDVVILTLQTGGYNEFQVAKQICLVCSKKTPEAHRFFSQPC